MLARTSLDASGAERGWDARGVSVRNRKANRRSGRTSGLPHRSPLRAKIVEAAGSMITQARRKHPQIGRRPA
jgi:hypothetical protein